jgi:hypothetical protein
MYRYSEMSICILTSSELKIKFASSFARRRKSGQEDEKGDCGFVGSLCSSVQPTASLIPTIHPSSNPTASPRPSSMPSSGPCTTPLLRPRNTLVGTHFDPRYTSTSTGAIGVCACEDYVEQNGCDAGQMLANGTEKRFCKAKRSGKKRQTPLLEYSTTMGNELYMIIHKVLQSSMYARMSEIDEVTQYNVYSPT